MNAENNEFVTGQAMAQAHTKVSSAISPLVNPEYIVDPVTNSLFSAFIVLIMSWSIPQATTLVELLAVLKEAVAAKNLPPHSKGS